MDTVHYDNGTKQSCRFLEDEGRNYKVGASYIGHMNDDAPEVDSFSCECYQALFSPLPLLRREPGNEAKSLASMVVALIGGLVLALLHCCTSSKQALTSREESDISLSIKVQTGCTLPQSIVTWPIYIAFIQLRLHVAIFVSRFSLSRLGMRIGGFTREA